VLRPAGPITTSIATAADPTETRALPGVGAAGYNRGMAIRRCCGLGLVSVLACSSASKPAPAPAAAPAHDHRHHGAMPHRFEDAEAWAKVFDDPTRDAWQQPDRVIASLALDRTMTVADIGAGTGYFAVRLAPLVAEVIATDVEPDMVRYLAERARRDGHANLRAALTPPDDPQLAPGSCDRILVVDVWHHLGDRRGYAAKLAAALAPDGILAIVDYQLDASRGPPPAHRLAPDAIIADLEAAGLTASVALELPEQYVIHARR
jgi:SAM-dependent methyltransferase